MDTDTLYGLLYWAYRAHCGRIRGSLYSQAKRRWRILHPLPPGGYICYLCHRPIPKAQFTMDHVIPLKAIYDLNLDMSLIWDVNNLEPAHELCNTWKAHSYPGYTPAETLTQA